MKAQFTACFPFHPWAWRNYFQNIITRMHAAHMNQQSDWYVCAVFFAEDFLHGLYRTWSWHRQATMTRVPMFFLQKWMSSCQTASHDRMRGRNVFLLVCQWMFLSKDIFEPSHTILARVQWRELHTLNLDWHRSCMRMITWWLSWTSFQSLLDTHWWSLRSRYSTSHACHECTVPKIIAGFLIFLLCESWMTHRDALEQSPCCCYLTLLSMYRSHIYTQEHTRSHI